MSPSPNLFQQPLGGVFPQLFNMDGNSYAVLLGNSDFLLENQIEGVTEQVQKEASALSDQGKTVLFLAVDSVFAGLLAIADPLKEEAGKTIRDLEAMGIKVVMLTGDNEKTAQAVANQAGIKRVVAGVLPDKKEEEVVRLQQEGEIVAMIGDGINDAPALARADVGMAMGTGIDVAMESADIVLMNGHLAGIGRAIGLSRATMRNIRQNLFWAFAYNVVGIPVAAGLLAHLRRPNPQSDDWRCGNGAKFSFGSHQCSATQVVPACRIVAWKNLDTMDKIAYLNSMQILYTLDFVVLRPVTAALMLQSSGCRRKNILSEKTGQNGEKYVFNFTYQYRHL